MVLGVVDSIAVTCFAVAINKWYFHLPCDPNFDAKTCREKIKIFLSNQKSEILGHVLLITFGDSG